MRNTYLVIITIFTFFIYSDKVFANKYSCDGFYSITIKDETGIKVDDKECSFNIVVDDNDKLQITYKADSNGTISSGTKSNFTCAGKTVHFYNANVKPAYADFNVFQSVYLATMKNNKGNYSCCPELSFSNITGNYYVVVKNASSGYYPENPGGGEGEHTEYDYKKKFVLCEDKNSLTVFKVLGIIFTILKILVPIILVVIGAITLSQAIIKSDSDAITKAAVSLGKKVALGILIFFIPTIVRVVFGLVKNVGKTTEEFADCMICLTGSTSDCNNIIDSLDDKEE